MLKAKNAMGRKSERSSVVCIAAGVLAVIWFAAGAAAVVVGLAHGRWLVPLLGFVAIWYGLVWIRVAREGRRMKWPEGLLPWRRS